MNVFNSTIKKIAHKIHLWIGLFIGLIFFVIALSGAIYTWEPEISRIIYKQNVVPQEVSFVSVSSLKSSMEQEFPEADFRTALYQGRERTVNVLLYVPGTYYYAFMNPYTGELVHLQNMKKGWLNHLKLLHRNLMLGDIGRNIVHWVTLIALFMLITGIILWLPINKSNRKRRFILKWKAPAQRLNYDFHNVLGFYASGIAIFSILTGIFWGFGAVKKSIQTITKENQIVYDKPNSIENNSSEIPELSQLIDSLTVSFREKNQEKIC